MKKYLVIAMAIAVALSWAASAQAQQPKHPPLREIFEKADANHDGQVIFDELKAVMPNLTQERFTKLDRNKDGVLTKADLPPNPGQVVRHLLKKADKNNDGKVTLEEAKALAPKMTQERFAKLDRNHDGVLSPEDIPAAPPQGPQAGQGPRPGQGPEFAAKLKQADTNNDGKVTLEEAQKVFPKMTKEAFDRRDRNHDGVLTAEDRPPQGPRPGRGQGPNLMQKIRAADTNNDGKVTFEEAKKADPNITEEQFKKLDRNGDGVISQEDRGPRP